MEITYLGHSCFKIIGKKVSVLSDPYDPEKIGIKLAKQDADVVTVSHDHFDHNYLEVVKSEFLLLDSPGEYEVKESEFQGIKGFHDDSHGEERGQITIFNMEIDGIKICHLGDLGTELTSEQLDKVDGVDVLMIPVGGKYTIDAKAAIKVISQIEPKIVLPMHYREGKMTDLAPLETFLQEFSVSPVPMDKLKITGRDLPEELEVVVLRY
ncbi:MAG: MBL fold metallo-hydrolase [Patescibacteria group bacterium]